MLKRRQFAASSLALLAGPRAARAQTWPDRPIRILVGYAAGGGVDIVARLLAEPMKQAFGRTVLIENRTGASGMIAAGTVAKATPDGLTLLMAASGEVAINQHLYKDKMAYDPLRELAPVALLVDHPVEFLVPAIVSNQPATLLGAHPNIGAKWGSEPRCPAGGVLLELDVGARSIERSIS